MLLSTAVPTIAFAGVTEVPAQAWEIVERAIPAYGDDWWFTGLLAFIRQEQGRFDEAMDLSCRSLAEEPAAGHSAHARAHAHYETGDHGAGLAWMDDWVRGDGAGTDSLSHFSWHAALHELSLGDLDAVRRRYDSQLRPDGALGCRALVDTGSLLFRWALTPGRDDVPAMRAVADATPDATLRHPATPFLAMHAAVCTSRRTTRSRSATSRRWAARHDHPTHREVVAPLARALRSMATGSCSSAADQLAALDAQTWRLGGSDAQREVIEEARISALLRSGRLDEARQLLDDRLDRRESPRDRRWRTAALPTTAAAAQLQADRRPLTEIGTSLRATTPGRPDRPSVMENLLPWQAQLMVPSVDARHDAALVGADRREALELARRRLGDHDLLVGEDPAAALRHVAGAGERVGRRLGRLRCWPTPMGVPLGGRSGSALLGSRRDRSRCRRRHRTRRGTGRPTPTTAAPVRVCRRVMPASSCQRQPPREGRRQAVLMVSPSTLMVTSDSARGRRVR